MTSPKIALATYALLPELDDDNQVLLDAFREAGIEAVPAVWDDPQVDWSAFDLVIVRSTWDYSNRRDEYIAWARSVPRILNTADVLEWNTDKYYLKHLGDQGVNIIPTLWLDPAKHLTSQAIHTRLPAFGDFVIKPTISAGAQDTIRYRESSAEARGEAILHVRSLLRAGRHVMVQRYFTKVDTVGETSLIYIAGEFSHAVRKNAMLHRGMAPTAGLYQRETMSHTEATQDQLDLAAKVLDASAQSLGINVADLLYARVDTLPDEEGVPHLLELELTEPALFFAKSPDAVERFVTATKALLA